MSKKNTPEAPKSDVRGRTSYNIQYETIVILVP